MPRDPNVDMHYSYSYITHDIIPVGAKNPQAAVAYNAVIRYNSLSPQIREEALQKSKTEWNYTDLLIEQIDELHREGYGDIVPVYDQLEIIGYNATWDCIYNSLPWATAIEARSAESEAYIAEILEVKEVDLPSGPKVIEQFEKYAINTDEPIPFNKLYSVSGGNPNWEAYLDKENKYQGNFATKVYYTFDEKDGADWGGFTKNLNITWNTNNTFTFWAKGDGKPQEVTIQFEAGDVPWTYTMTVDGTKGKVYEIPFSEFKVPDWWEDQAAQLDLTLIKTVSFIFKGEGDRHICLDDIRVIRK